MPSFGGMNVFGSSVQMITTDHPRARQKNAFFGLSGLELMDGGSRGRSTQVDGLLSGNAPALLASAEGAFRSMADGVARTLVDTLGSAWPNVILESFKPTGRALLSSDGVFVRPYRARFLHLS